MSKKPLACWSPSVPFVWKEHRFVVHYRPSLPVQISRKPAYKSSISFFLCFSYSRVQPFNCSFSKFLFGIHTFYQVGGGGSARPPAISKTVAPMNLTFCRLLERPLKVLEMLKFFTYCLLGYHSNSSKERCFGGKSVDFSRKYQ